MSDPQRAILGMRQVHLDFHTAPSIPDVGSAFDADRFARTFTPRLIETQASRQLHSTGE